jgi:hypothetical protein
MSPKKFAHRTDFCPSHEPYRETHGVIVKLQQDQNSGRGQTPVMFLVFTKITHSPNVHVYCRYH